MNIILGDGIDRIIISADRNGYINLRHVRLLLFGAFTFRYVETGTAWHVMLGKVCPDTRIGVLYDTTQHGPATTVKKKTAVL